MIGEKIRDLINREIDGANSPKASARLHAYLKENPDARREYEELLALFRTLARIPKADPPDNLKKRILNAVEWKARAMRAKPHTETRGPDDRFAFTVKKYGFGFAFGFASAALVFVLWSVLKDKQAWLDVNQITGTLTAEKSGPATDFRKEYRIDGKGVVTGTIRWQGRRSLALLEIDLESSRETSATVEFDRGRTVFEGFRRRPSAALGLSAEDTRVRLAGIGRQHAVLVFRNTGAGPGPMPFRIASADSVVFETVLNVKPE